MKSLAAFFVLATVFSSIGWAQSGGSRAPVPPPSGGNTSGSRPALPPPSFGPGAGSRAAPRPPDSSTPPPSNASCAVSQNGTYTVLSNESCYNDGQPSETRDRNVILYSCADKKPLVPKVLGGCLMPDQYAKNCRRCP